MLCALKIGFKKEGAESNLGSVNFGTKNYICQLCVLKSGYKLL